MPNSFEVPRHLRTPGDDGFRTPTIEDAELEFCVQCSTGGGQEGGGESLHRVRSVREVHTSALENLQRSYLRGGGNNGNALHHASSYADGDHTHGTVDGRTGSATGDVSWKERIRHSTWAFFTLTMATGGIANVLYAIPYRFRGLDIIGDIVFLLNIVFYIIIWALLITRFVLYPYTFKASFLHPTESLFVPATIVSFGTILINISQYGPLRTARWLDTTTEILFWIDSALAVLFSGGIYLVLWSTQTFTIAQMTPIWIFPAYPMLIIGPHAGILSAKLRPSRALKIIIGGTTIQGIGFLMSLMVYSAFIYRLMTQKLPRENVRPGMFVSVGPSGFTVAGLVNMASNAKRAFPSDFMGNGNLAADVLRVVVDFACLWLWGLAFFFFFISIFAHYSAIGPGRMVFSMTWYSFIFPNTALITATFAIGAAFNCAPIEIIGTAMVIPLIAMYLFVFGMMIRAIVTKQILWPQKGEDKDEGGFEINQIKRELPGEGSPV